MESDLVIKTRYIYASNKDFKGKHARFLVEMPVHDTIVARITPLLSVTSSELDGMTDLYAISHKMAVAGVDGTKRHKRYRLVFGANYEEIQ